MKTLTVLILTLALSVPAYASNTYDACGSCGCGNGAEKTETKKAPIAFDAPPKTGTKATCPVMGGEFTVSEKSLRSEYKGKHYVFCCAGCKPKFDAEPEKYLAPEKS